MTAIVPKNIEPIGIICKDPAVGYAIHREMLRIMQMDDAGVPPPHLAIYADPNNNDYIADGYAAMEQLNAAAVFLPDSDEGQNGLPRIELNHKQTKDILDGKTLSIPAIEAWAKHLAGQSGALKRAKPLSPLPVDPGHRTNFAHLVAIHGGMGPVAGNEAYRQLAKTYDGPTLLFSAYIDHGTIDYMQDIKKSGRSRRENNLGLVCAAREAIEKLRPAVTVMACNTMHADYDEIVRHCKTPTVHVIESALQALPEQSRALILETGATQIHRLFQTAREKIKKRVLFSEPNEERQRQVDAAINTILCGGDDKQVIALLENIVQTFKLALQSLGHDPAKGRIILGCSDLGYVLERNHVKTDIACIDPVQEAIYRACAIAKGEGMGNRSEYVRSQ